VPPRNNPSIGKCYKPRLGSVLSEIVILSAANRFALRESVCGLDGPAVRLHDHWLREEFLSGHMIFTK
jgi:hypothetical protein